MNDKFFSLKNYMERITIKDFFPLFLAYFRATDSCFGIKLEFQLCSETIRPPEQPKANQAEAGAEINQEIRETNYIRFLILEQKWNYFNYMTFN